MGIDLSTGHHVGWQAARALVLGWAGKRTGSVAAGWLTCAMPEPISPPPMTVTCLTTIFFAEAEAVDEEAMARMKCLVTKAMLRKREGRRSRGDGGQRRDKGNKQGKNGEVTAARPPAARGLLRAEAQAAPPPARPGHHQPAPAAGRDASPAPPIGRGHPDGVQTLERGRGSGPTWTGARRRPPPQSRGLAAGDCRARSPRRSEAGRFALRCPAACGTCLGKASGSWEDELVALTC